MKISTKLLLITIGSNAVLTIVLALLAISSFSQLGDKAITEYAHETLGSKKEGLKQLVESSVSIMQSYHEKQKKGELTQKEALTQAMNVIKDIRYNEGRGYFWVNTMDKPYPKMVMHPISPTLDGKVLDNPKYNCALGKDENLFVAFVDACSRQGEGFIDYLWPDPLDKTKRLDKLSYVKLFGPWNVVIGTGVYNDEVDKMVAIKHERVSEAIQGAILYILGASIILVLITLGGVLTMTSSIKRQFHLFIKNFETLATGNLTTQVEIKSKDEFGVLGEAFNSFAQRVRESIRNVVNTAHILQTDSSTLLDTSDGMGNSLNQMIDKTGHVTTVAGVMRDKMNGTVSSAESISSIVGSVVEHSSSVTGTMNWVAEESKRSMEKVSMVAAATEEMSATIEEIASNAEQARNSTSKAVDSAETAQSSVDKLGAAASDINDIINVIVEIAEQTKLLALNATIEAARAGEAGKGFAVVASEVKDLAKQTNLATDDIRHKINIMQKSTDNTIEEITKINGVISNVNDIVNVIASSVEEQSITTKDISQNIHMAAEGISSMTGKIDSSADEITTLTNDLSNVADSVTQVIKNASSAADISSEIAQAASEANDMIHTIHTNNTDMYVNFRKLADMSVEQRELVDRYTVE